MDQKLTSILQASPGWLLFAGIGVLCLLLGLLAARQLWGRSGKKLKSSLDESAYLASQWATLALSQSQLVEKLGHKICSGFKEFGIREAQIKAEVRHRERTIENLEQQILRMEKGRDELTGRDVEALQLQAAEVEKRDRRIQTLESRLSYFDEQIETKTTEHQKQVKLLLDRIAVLEKIRSNPDEELVRNNGQLTELLKKRCGELESIKDEFHAKEKALASLREHNAVLKKSIDEIMAGWSKKKGRESEGLVFKAQLAEATIELNEIRRVNDRHLEEIHRLNELLARKRSPEGAEAVRERSSAEIDILLDVIENRDRRVEELERQIQTFAKTGQVAVLSQTISDLQNQLSQARRPLPEQEDGSSGSSRMLSESKSSQSRPISPKLGRGKKSLIFFEEKSSSIKRESFAVIQEIAREVLETHCQLSLSGYAGDEGDDPFKKNLSLLRAEAVKERFLDEGVAPSHLIVKGLGEDTRSLRGGEPAKARRVEIVALPVAEIVN